MAVLILEKERECLSVFSQSLLNLTNIPQSTQVLKCFYKFFSFFCKEKNVIKINITVISTNLNVIN